MSLETIRSLSIRDVAGWLLLPIDRNNKLKCFNTSAHKHGDLRPSLSLDISNNRFKCFSCGVSGSGIDLVMGYMNIDFKGAVNELEKSFFSKDEREYSLSEIEKWKLSKKVFNEYYDYVHYIKVRFRDPDNKKDKQDLFFTKTKSGKYVKGRNCAPVLYNQNHLAQRPNEIVCFTEGEGCVDILNLYGFLSTTAGSATVSTNTFTPEMISKLQNREVVVFADHDGPGYKMVEDLSSLIHLKIKSLKQVDIKKSWLDSFGEEMPGKADVKDFILKYEEIEGIDGLKEIIDSMIGSAKPVEKPVQRNNSIDTIRAKYFEGKTFVPQYLSQDILKAHKLLYSDKQFYHYESGYWKSIDVDHISEIIKKRLGKYSRNNRISETLTDTKLSVLLKSDLKLNNKKEYINLQNGMLNWIEQKLIPHDSNYFSSVRINANYNPDAKCPRWDQFLKETLQPDTVKILQEFFGYCLIPDNCFEKSIILVGSGSNGKSVTLSVLTGLIGNCNVAKISLQNLNDRFKTVELHNRLVNIFADMSSQTLKDTGVFKMLTSGDPITVERKHQNPFSFVPFCRLIFSCNQLPKSLDKSFAYYRRLIILPFKNSFTGEVQDKTLKGKLVRELDGILAWSLQGLHRLFEQQDFSASETTNDVLEDYKLDNNNVLLFVKEGCVVGDNFRVDKADLYRSYREFCEQASLRAVSRQRFNHELIDNYSNVRETMNHFSKKRAWRGIGINNN